jgi:hypothetical protein
LNSSLFFGTSVLITTYNLLESLSQLKFYMIETY